MINIVKENCKVAERITELAELTLQVFDLRDGRSNSELPTDSFQTLLDRFPAVEEALTIAPYLRLSNSDNSAIVRCAMCMMGIDPAWPNRDKALSERVVASMTTRIKEYDFYRMTLHTLFSFMAVTKEMRELVEFANIECVKLLEMDDDDDTDDMRDFHLIKQVEPLFDYLETHPFIQYLVYHFAGENQDKDDDEEEDELKNQPL